MTSNDFFRFSHTPHLMWLGTLVALQDLLQQAGSQYRDGGLEGIVLRREDSHWLKDRCKLVHPHFAQAIGEHWSRKKLQWNQVAC